MEPTQSPTPHDWLSFQLESEAIYSKACKLLPLFKESWPAFKDWYALPLAEQDEEIDRLGHTAEPTPETDDLLVLMFERAELAAKLFADVLAGGSLSPSERFEMPDAG